MPSTRGVPSKPPPPESLASSSSLSSATRQDRSTRATHQKSATPRSQSSEDISIAPRRSQRSHPAHSNDSPSKEPGDMDEELADEEEITRCVCGHQDYPGPPQSEAFTSLPDVHAEDAGGLFIQCDLCLVWQHGGCVGIVEESQSPDKYFCDECRPKLHLLQLDPRGQRYSIYLPLHPKSQRKSSVSKSDDKPKKEREPSVSRASVDPSTGKRRATMRSKEHDDEEEQLKRAIEESKRVLEPLDGATGKKNGKRSREESEDSHPEVKRPRTASESLPPAVHSAAVDGEDPEDETSTTSKLKRVKADAAQSARHAEQRERFKERDKARAEAAGRRQERAGRRRGEDAEPPEESTPKPSSADASPPPASSQPSTPPPPTEKISHKKGASKKAKKLGNNQYTKARLESAAAATPSGRKASGSIDDPAEPNTTQDGLAGNNPSTLPSSTNNAIPGKPSPPNSVPPDTGPTNGHTNGNASARGRLGKGKKSSGNHTNGHAPKITPDEVEKTFVNMKGALDAMSAFIAKQQLDVVAGADPSPSRANLLAGEDAFYTTTSSAGGGAVQAPGIQELDKLERRSFEELNSAEMAEMLNRGIAAWNAQWGHMAA